MEQINKVKIKTNEIKQTPQELKKAAYIQLNTLLEEFNKFKNQTRMSDTPNSRTPTEEEINTIRQIRKRLTEYRRMCKDNDAEFSRYTIDNPPPNEWCR